MSFILDALKKSEIERQEQAGPSVSLVREARPQRTRPLWIAALAALLTVNLVAILFFALRSGGDDRDAPPPARDEMPSARESAPPGIAEESPRESVAPAERPAAGREVRPLEAEVEPPEAGTGPPGAVPPALGAEAAGPALSPETAAPAANDLDFLPTFNELVIEGRLELPPMHIDVHVFSDTPASRFVFIDGRKYQEGERLTNGPQVETITEDGVVLSHQGERFLLPRS